MRRTVPRLLASFAVVLAGMPWAPRARGEGAVQAAHVLVEGEVPFALVEEAAGLAEALWPHLVLTFGAEPERTALPLQVRLFADTASFLVAAREAGASGDLARTGGWTSFERPVSFVAVQPEAFDTRRLVLHEVTHQFQVRLHGQGVRHEPAWHREGLAEHLGWHRRIPPGLEVGALDVIAFRHRPRAAALRAATVGFDPWAIATGRSPADYTDGMVLVEALRRTTDADLTERYRRWSADALRGRAGPARFADLFAGKEAALAAAVRDVWRGVEIPWVAEGPGWDEGPEGIVGASSRETSLKGTRPLVSPALATARIAPEGEALAGIALGDPETEEWATLWLGPNEVRLTVTRGGAEEVVASRPRAATGGSAGPTSVRLGVSAAGIRAEGGEGENCFSWTVAGEASGLSSRWESPVVRLRVQGGRAAFREITRGEANRGSRREPPRR